MTISSRAARALREPFQATRGCKARAVYVLFKQLLSLYIGNHNVRCGRDSGMLTEMKTDKCEAYEVIALKQKKVEMKENPAYEEISHYTTIN